MQRALFLVVTVFSIGLMSAIDGTCFSLLQKVAPGLAWIADFRLTSLAVVVLVGWLVLPPSAWRPPTSAPPRRLVVTTVLWLTGVLATMLLTDTWTYEPTRVADFVAFLGTGLLVEEILFRGIVFELAKDALRGSSETTVPPWVWVSAAAFSASHLQFHGYSTSPAALTQMALTIPFGLILGLLRERTSSLWLPILVHVLNNLVTLTR